MAILDAETYVGKYMVVNKKCINCWFCLYTENERWKQRKASYWRSLIKHPCLLQRKDSINFTSETKNLKNSYEEETYEKLLFET